MAIITNDTFNIGKFAEVDGVTVHIGTDRDLLNIIESNCGYEIAEIVGEFVNWSLEVDKISDYISDNLNTPKSGNDVITELYKILKGKD